MQSADTHSLPSPHVLLDSTLRDGEQSPGVALTPEEKAHYVEMAEAAGVRYIEIGFPHNPFDYAACEAASRAAKVSRLVAMALTQRESIDKVADVGAQEVLFIVPCSESHLAAVFGGTLEELSAQMLESIAHAHDRGLAVNIGLEDASQGDLHVIRSLLEEVRRHGTTVDCVTIADTRGQLLPAETVRLVGVISEQARGIAARVAFHAHNDLGLATANSIVALCADPGADCVHVTSCGFGERAGNASLEQVAVILGAKLGREPSFDLVKLGALTSFVQRAFLTPIHPHAPVIGSKVFQHESGIHQKALLSESRTFQFLDPELFGRSTGMVLGKHSGKRMRKEIASRAGCTEQEVAELQGSLLAVNKRRLVELFVGAVRDLYEMTFIGLDQADAVRLLRERCARAGEGSAELEADG